MFSPDGKWWWNGTKWVGSEWGPKRQIKKAPSTAITAIRVVWITVLFGMVGFGLALLLVGLGTHQYH